ncbi:glycosyltransferase [Streptomyces finlayi]|uniref:glycosyltransferase n=1 Tax=Streptomyces finlayi TaxID=67296 RepID=UPI001E43F8A3|nr:glycosyltransferase [Streptomyces finlayi]
MSTARRPRITVVQPYVTGYRAPFLARLGPELDARGIDLTVAHGRPTPWLVARGDAVRLPGARELPQRSVELAGRTLIWRDLGELAERSDVLVVEQALHNLESLPHLLRPGRRGPAVALWGHGSSRTVRHGSGLRAVKRALTRRAHWFFAYTDSGAKAVGDTGFPGERITVVRNTIDTGALVAAREAVTDAEVARFRSEHRLVQGRTALYIGALDATKRLGFLLDAAERIARELPGFRLIVAGDGDGRGEVERAAAAGAPVVYVGRTTGDAHKALLGAASDLMLVPGLVGLVAVDSFALRTPVLTVRSALHGPEFDYLRDGHNAVITHDCPGTYAATAVALLTGGAELDRLREACRTDAERYTIGGMAERFARGAQEMVRALPNFGI